MIESQLGDVAVPRFARHETFAPRFGWLHKAYRAVQEDDEAFLRKDATVTLGVGKNMVNAIRYWATAFKVTTERSKGGTSRANIAEPTWPAMWLLGDEGADPYLEDPGSLWLLHWWLLSQQGHEQVRLCEAPTWWVAFNMLPSGRFTDDQLVDLVQRQLTMSGWSTPAPASIRKDVDCLTKMYAPRAAVPGSPGSFEDVLDCPFRELGLLESVESGSRTRTWRLTSTARATLPSPVMTYACLDYAARAARRAGSISIARLANEPGGPGRAFQVREPELAAALIEVSNGYDGLGVTDAVGQRSLVFKSDPDDLAWDVLDEHYAGVRHKPWRSARHIWQARYAAPRKIQASEVKAAAPTLFGVPA